MTFADLLNYLQENSKYTVLDGDIMQTIAKTESNTYENPLMGEIIKHLFAAVNAADVNAPITRAQATTALGPLRLIYMKDDAPVDGFRMLGRIIHTIDGAFNDEALHEKYRGQK